MSHGLHRHSKAPRGRYRRDFRWDLPVGGRRCSHRIAPPCSGNTCEACALQNERASLVATSGISPGHAAAPAQLALSEPGIWPLGEAFRSQKTQVLTELGRRFEALPSGAWSDPPKAAAIVPVSASGATGTSAILVVGLNPFRLFDEGYGDFLNLVAGQLGSSIANAEAYERERRRAEELAELDRAKTTFFSNVSHEFRTPLTLMLGPIEDALRTPSRALTGENLQTAYRSSLRLLKLVNSLLDFSRIEAGACKPRSSPPILRR